MKRLVQDLKSYTQKLLKNVLRLRQQSMKPRNVFHRVNPMLQKLMSQNLLVTNL